MEAREAALFELALRMGDTALILGQRVSEWCGHAPALEEDIALANTALDLLGQTQMWLELAGEVEGKGRSADDLAFLRDAWDFRNLVLAEQPNTDFGHTIMRQYLIDAWNRLMLDELQNSADARIASIAGKAARETAYHLERSRDLVIRLGDGSEESHARMQAALNTLWPFTDEFFEADDGDALLAAEGIGPDTAALAPQWQREVQASLAAATLDIPEGRTNPSRSRSGRHTEHLGHLLATMQWLQRAYPGARW
ncbi:MAG: phenylacetate-CoA oxygenase subunit PaaI [Alphaproteobacteria bacterium]|nr:MAG: phenylacetate-CoA oxygenase subunit PaaI [Alphaproteobacteria bacterium]